MPIVTYCFGRSFRVQSGHGLTLQSSKQRPFNFCFFAGANLNLQFKFAPATTRVVAGRKPGENAFAMGSSARLKDAFSFPLDSVVNDAQPSEMDGFNGTHSNADFEDLICTLEHIFSISWPCFASRLV